MNRKVVIVTGASRGIGSDIALKFGIAGYAVLIHYNSSVELANELKSKIELLGGCAEIVGGDLSIKEEAKKIVDRAFDLWGKVDVLVNNAGITKDSSFVMMRDDDWNRVLNVNLGGVYNVSRSLIYRMVRARQGVIINMASVAALKGIVGQVNYCSSKSAIVGFTKALAKEVAPYDVRVNCIAPGYIDTDMLKNMSKEKIDKAKAEIPMGVFGEVDDISEMAFYLASKKARYITGQVFCIDGGLTA